MIKLQRFVCLVFSSAALLLAGCDTKQEVFQGYIEGQFTYVTSQIAGKLEKLFVARGDQVTTNQLLFVLDQEPETSELMAHEQKYKEAKKTLDDMERGSRDTIIFAIKAQREQAKANLELAQKTLNRYRKILQAGAIDKASVDQKEADYKSAKQKVNESEANLAEAMLGARSDMILAQKAALDAAASTVKKAEWALKQKTQYAPENAQVFDTFFTCGEIVNPGKPVVALLAPENIWVIFFVPERLLHQIKIGKKITFTCASCKEELQAKIGFISQEAEYTPPVIYSEASREKLVYRVEAYLDIATAKMVHVGQPVEIKLGG